MQRPQRTRKPPLRYEPDPNERMTDDYTDSEDEDEDEDDGGESLNSDDSGESSIGEYEFGDGFLVRDDEDIEMDDAASSDEESSADSQISDDDEDSDSDDDYSGSGDDDDEDYSGSEDSGPASPDPAASNSQS